MISDLPSAVVEWIAKEVGLAPSIGVAVARNYIGWNPDYNYDIQPYYKTGDTNVAQIVTGNKVKIVAGPNAGNVYQYIGTETLNRPNGPAPDDETDEEQEARQQEEANWLTRLNYADNSQWRLVNLDPDAAQVQAYILDSSVDATGARLATPPSLHVDHLLADADPTRYDVLYVAGGEGVAALGYPSSRARLPR